jgi:hypothetical protein
MDLFSQFDDMSFAVENPKNTKIADFLTKDFCQNITQGHITSLSLKDLKTPYVDFLAETPTPSICASEINFDRMFDFDSDPFATDDAFEFDQLLE